MLKKRLDKPNPIRAGGTLTLLGMQMTTTTYLNVSSAADLSADIKAIDLASQTDGGNMNYVITLQAGATLTESAEIAAINLVGHDTLTINGQGT
jgi:hypothetical protein